MKKAVESKAAENPLYHDTWMHIGGKSIQLFLKFMSMKLL